MYLPFVMTSTLILTDFPGCLCSTANWCFLVWPQEHQHSVWLMGIVGSSQICLYSTSSFTQSIHYVWMRLVTVLHNYHIWSHSFPSFPLFLMISGILQQLLSFLMLWFNSDFKCKFDNTSWKLWMTNKRAKLPLQCFHRSTWSIKALHTT